MVYACAMRWHWLALGVLTLGCDDDRKKQDLVAKAMPSALPSASVSAATPPSASPIVEAGPKPLGERLRCDRLLPEKTLPGPISNLKIGQAPSTCPECGPTCTLVSAANPLGGATIVYACNEKFEKAGADKKLDKLKKALKKSKPIDFGRAGISGEKDNGLLYEVVVWDDDSDCVVTVDWMRGKRDDVLVAAKFAMQAIKQSDLP
jgi:hypothetical protein